MALWLFPAAGPRGADTPLPHRVSEACAQMACSLLHRACKQVLKRDPCVLGLQLAIAAALTCWMFLARGQRVMCHLGHAGGWSPNRNQLGFLDPQGSS